MSQSNREDAENAKKKLVLKTWRFWRLGGKHAE
jgi:hypothetical protein